MRFDALVHYAYQLTGSEPLEGLPEVGQCQLWLPDSAGTFTIEATMPANHRAQSSEMMQALLAERFKLAAHWENQTIAGIRN